MRTRSILIATAMLALATPAMSHDFWLDIASHRQAAGRAFPVRFLIGDVTEVEPWETLWRKVVSLRSYGPAGAVDHQAGLVTSEAGRSGGASITLAGEGTHVLAFESYQSESDLPAAEFTAYAEHEGLAVALAHRKQTGTSDARGRELYSRRAKALVQVGARPSDDALRPIGQTLEIVPERNPYALGAGDRLPVRIYYRGRPLGGAGVVMERIDVASVHGVPETTDADGRASFAFEKVGRWRVNVVWTQPIEHPRAEFDTVFSSLTFGY